jgi:hypothetical protein
MMDIKKCEYLYRSSPEFHAMVRALEQQITQLNMTPHEIRQAAMYAAYRAELYRRDSDIDFMNKCLGEWPRRQDDK